MSVEKYSEVICSFEGGNVNNQEGTPPFLFNRLDLSANDLLIFYEFDEVIQLLEEIPILGPVFIEDCGQRWNPNEFFKTFKIFSIEVFIDVVIDLSEALCWLCCSIHHLLHLSLRFLGNLLGWLLGRHCLFGGDCFLYHFDAWLLIFLQLTH